MSNSLKITPPSLPVFVRDISNTKNHAVKKTPIAVSMVAKCGNTAGLIGDTCLTIDSMILSKKFQQFLVKKNVIGKMK